MPSELFEKKLREKLSQATIPPSPELWNNIEARVAGNDSKRGFGFWILLLALLLGSVGMLWGFWYYNTTDSPQQAIAEVQMESPPAPLNPINDPESIPENSLTTIDGLSSSEDSDISYAGEKEENAHEFSDVSAAPKHFSNKTHSPSPELTNATNSLVSEDSKLYRSKALDAGLKEELIHTVPQHANTAQPESQGLSEPSSVSLYKEIEEDNGMELKIAQLDPLADSPEILKTDFSYPKDLQALKKAKFKRWSFLAYTDFHKGYRDLDITNSLASEDLLLLPGAEDQAAGYQYDGLIAPGNLQVVIPEESISLGVLAEWKLNRKLSLQGGIEYGLFSLGTYNLNIVDNSSALPASRFNSPLSSRNTQFRYHQMGIPLQVNYKVMARGRSSLEVYGGASVYAARAYSKSITQSANFYDFTTQRATEEFDVSNTISSDVPGLIQYHPFHLTYQAGFNFSRHFSDKHSIFFGPQIKFQGSPVYKEQQREINEIPYYVGFRLGFKFSN